MLGSHTTITWIRNYIESNRYKLISSYSFLLVVIVILHIITAFFPIHWLVMLLCITATIVSVGATCILLFLYIADSFYAFTNFLPEIELDGCGFLGIEIAAAFAITSAILSGSTYYYGYAQNGLLTFLIISILFHCSMYACNKVSQIIRSRKEFYSYVVSVIKRLTVQPEKRRVFIILGACILFCVTVLYYIMKLKKDQAPRRE